MSHSTRGQGELCSEHWQPLHTTEARGPLRQRLSDALEALPFHWSCQPMVLRQNLHSPTPPVHLSPNPIRRDPITGHPHQKRADRVEP